MTLQDIKNNVPNAVTCLNLLCGTLAIIVAFSGDACAVCGLSGYRLAFALIALGAVAEFMDGFTARLLHAASGIGKQLDSLSDLVTFGLAPAMVLLNVMRAAAPDSLLCYFAVLLPVFGALRLARFNVDDNQTTTFTGLPIPANAIFWIGFIDWYATHPGMSPWLAVACVVVLSLLMVCRLRMFSLKMHGLSLKAHWAQYLLILVTVVLLAVLGLPALAVCIALYVVLALIKHDD